MNKVITINLGGTAYQLEDGAYEALRAYLESASERLQGNPDRDEIISDIEWAVAEKFRALLSSHKNVVTTSEGTTVLAEMGPIEADADKAAASSPGDAGAASGAGTDGAAGAAKAGQASGGPGAPRRLYRIHEGAMVAGVCNGLATYVNLDPTLVRLAFVFLTLLWGIGGLVYLVMVIVVPEARSPEERAAASGGPSTTQEFIRRAKAGYYEAMRGFPNRQARREWKRKFKREMRGHADQWRHEWRHHWHAHWAEHGPFHPGMSMAMPMFSLLHGAAKILWICALVSLLATGTMLGMALPASVPVWVAVILLFFLFGILEWPFKAVRRACYWGMGRPGPVWTLAFLLDAVVWLAVVIVLLVLAGHYFPDLREAIHNLPVLFHQAMDDIQTWWKKK